MRITNGMMVTNMLRDITRNQERMDALNKNLSTGKKFLKPSDDPIGVSKSLRLNTDINIIAQFKKNVEDSQSWLGTTETATDNMINVLQKVRELTVQGANGTNSSAERGAISSEIDQLKNQLIHIGNTSYAGSYIFSGYKTDKPLLKEDGTYDLGGSELNNKEVMNVNLGVGDKFGLNFVGQRIFGVMKSGTDIDSPISQGVIDHTLKGGTDYISTTLFVPTPLVMNYGNPGTSYTLNVPAGVYANPNDLATEINNQINTDPALINLKNHVSANSDSGRINLVSDQPFELLPGSDAVLLGQMGIGTNVKAVKEKYSLESGAVDLFANSLTVVAGINDAFEISYGGTPPVTVPITLTAKTYDGSVGNDIRDIANQISADINTALAPGNNVVVQVKNNQLFFNSDMPLTFKNNSPVVSLDLTNLGIASGRASTVLGEAVKSGEETQLIGMLNQLIADLGGGNQPGITGALKRLDAHLGNINAARAEIGVKTNRLDLTLNRIEDDTLNLTALLSKNEDADMAEVIMNLKMEENVYKSSLSGGARIIQLTLLDFLR